MTTIAKKISIGGINNVRQGFSAIKLFGLRADPNNSAQDAPLIGDRDSVTVMTVVGLVNGYKEKTSETMGVSYAFSGEFQALNAAGENTIAPVCFLPEPAQGLIKAAVDDGNNAIEIGFVVEAIRNDMSIKGYDFKLRPLVEPKPSTALADLSARLLSGPAATTTETARAPEDNSAEVGSAAQDVKGEKPANGKKHR